MDTYLQDNLKLLALFPHTNTESIMNKTRNALLNKINIANENLGLNLFFSFNPLFIPICIFEGDNNSAKKEITNLKNKIITEQSQCSLGKIELIKNSVYFCANLPFSSSTSTEELLTFSCLPKNTTLIKNKALLGFFTDKEDKTNLLDQINKIDQTEKNTTNTKPNIFTFSVFKLGLIEFTQSNYGFSYKIPFTVWCNSVKSHLVK